MNIERRDAGSPADFAERLARPTATPGGGAAAARTGLHATSLVRMVTGLTLRRSAASEAVVELETVAARAAELGDEFRRLEDADIAAFSEFMAALRLPRDTEEQKFLRQSKLREAALKATEVPLTTLEAALKIFELAQRLLGVASSLRLRAESDLGGAVELAHAAFRAAALNVRVNLPVLKDAPELPELEQRFEGLEEELEERYPKLRQQIREWLERL